MENTIIIHGTFGSDFNLAVWQFWFQSPNLMYANTNYSQVLINVYSKLSHSPN